MIIQKENENPSKQTIATTKVLWLFGLSRTRRASCVIDIDSSIEPYCTLRDLWNDQQGSKVNQCDWKIERAVRALSVSFKRVVAALTNHPRLRGH